MNSRNIFIGSLSCLISIELIIYWKQHNFLFNLKKVSKIENIHDQETICYELKTNPHSTRETNDLLNQINDNFCNKVTERLKISYYPYYLRTLGSFLNIGVKCYWKNKYNYNVTYEKFHGVYFYTIYSKTKSRKRDMILFNGFGGFIIILSRLVNYFVDKGFTIHIPVYGPADGSLHYNFYFEDYYYGIILEYLIEKNIRNITITGWSLGGLLYKGFENYIKNQEIMLDGVFLFEPLICLNGILDCELTNYMKSLKRICKITKPKYFIYNFILCKFIYSTIGLATRKSLYAYNSAELIDSKKIYSYRRILFISENDMILNPIRDAIFISKNFYPSNVFYRPGYHGGWAKSRILSSLNI